MSGGRGILDLARTGSVETYGPLSLMQLQSSILLARMSYWYRQVPLGELYIYDKIATRSKNQQFSSQHLRLLQNKR
jgi:hypothetical protein